MNNNSTCVCLVRFGRRHVVQGKRPLATREATEEKQSIQKLAGVTEKEGKSLSSTLLVYAWFVCRSLKHLEPDMVLPSLK